MKAAQAVLAFIVGVLIFAAVEVASQQLGVRSAITASLWLDAVAYGLGSLLVRLILSPLFRRGRSMAAGVLAVLLFLILFPLATGLLGGLLDLSVSAGWDSPGLVRGAFTVTPINVLLTFALELWFVAVPAAVIGAIILLATTPARRRF